MALDIVVTLPGAAFAIADAGNAVLVVILEVDLAAVSARMREQIAMGIETVMLAAAVGVDMAHDVLGGVAIEPFLAPVRVHDAVGVAGDVIVVAALLTKCIGNVGQANVLVPLEPGVEAAIVGPFADRLRIGAAVDAGVVGEVHTASGAIGVAGNEMAVVPVLPGGAVIVLGADQVAVLVVIVVGGKLAHQLAIPDFPQGADATGIGVDLGAGVGDDGLALLADDVAEHRFAGMGTMGNDVVVAQAEGGAVAGMQRDQSEMLFAHLGGLGAYGVDQLVGFAPGAGFAFWQGLAEVEREQGDADARERDQLDRIVVPLADVKARVAVTAAIGGVIEQGGALALANHVDARAVRGEPARAEMAVVIGGQLAAVGAAPFDGKRRIKNEVGMGKGFGAGGKADRVRGAALCRTQLAGIGVALGRNLAASSAQFVAGIVLLVLRALA